MKLKKKHFHKLLVCEWRHIQLVIQPIPISVTEHGIVVYVSKRKINVNKKSGHINSFFLKRRK